MTDLDAIIEAFDALRADVAALARRVPPVLYKIPEAAAALGVDRAVIYRMMRDGTLRYVVLPGMSEKRIPVAAVEALVAPERWATTDELEVAS